MGKDLVFGSIYEFINSKTYNKSLIRNIEFKGLDVLGLIVLEMSIKLAFEFDLINEINHVWDIKIIKKKKNILMSQKQKGKSVANNHHAVDTYNPMEIEKCAFYINRSKYILLYY